MCVIEKKNFFILFVSWLIINSIIYNKNEEKINYNNFIKFIDKETEKMIESTKNGYENSFIFTFLYGKKITKFLLTLIF